MGKVLGFQLDTSSNDVFTTVDNTNALHIYIYIHNITHILIGVISPNQWK